MVEDSAIGLAAALGAGMRCIITYHSGTKAQVFEGAERIVGILNDGTKQTVELKELLAGPVPLYDDRTVAAK